MKTAEELNALKEEELSQVTGGGNFADLEQMTNVPEQYSASIKIEGGQQQRKP